MAITKGLSRRRRINLEGQGQTIMPLDLPIAASARAELTDVRKRVVKHRLDSFSDWPKVGAKILVVLDPDKRYGAGTGGGEASFAGMFLGVGFNPDPSVGYFGRVKPEDYYLSNSLYAWMPREIIVHLGDLRKKPKEGKLGYEIKKKRK